MKYLKAYGKALKEMATIAGPLYLAIAALQAEKALPMILAYLCVVSALAGPISVALISKKGTVCVKS